MPPRDQYGDAMASAFDDLYPPYDVPSVIARIERLSSPPARVVDFGVGTGRTAIPMALRGYEVLGIDVSQKMLSRLAEKDVAGSVDLLHDDFTQVRGDARFDLCTILKSALFMVEGRDGRSRTFAAAHSFLRAGGLLILETYSPLPFLGGSQTIHGFAAFGSGDRVAFDNVYVDKLAQKITTLRTFVSSAGISTMIEETWFAHLLELDQEAEAAGFRLVTRHGGWQEEPVSDRSEGFVSVYEKVAS